MKKESQYGSGNLKNFEYIKIDLNEKGKAETKMLFTAYHNKTITDEELKQNGVIRVNGWKDIEKILL